MANFKRKKCKRKVKCILCTPHKGMGNHSERRPPKEQALRKRTKKEMQDF